MHKPSVFQAFVKRISTDLFKLNIARHGPCMKIFQSPIFMFVNEIYSTISIFARHDPCIFWIIHACSLRRQALTRHLKNSKWDMTGMILAFYASCQAWSMLFTLADRRHPCMPGMILALSRRFDFVRDLHLQICWKFALLSKKHSICIIQINICEYWYQHIYCHCHIQN